VRKADVRGQRTELDCEDSDAALRALLTGYPETYDIEIRALGLEEAFLALTGESGRTSNTGEATR